MIPSASLSSQIKFISRLFRFYLIMVLKSIHFSSQMLLPCNWSYQLLLSEPLSDLLTGVMETLPCFPYYLCPWSLIDYGKAPLPLLSIFSLSLALLNLWCFSTATPGTFIWSDPYLLPQAFLLSPFHSLTCFSHTVHQLLEHCMFLPSLGLCTWPSFLCRALLSTITFLPPK